MLNYSTQPNEFGFGIKNLISFISPFTTIPLVVGAINTFPLPLEDFEVVFPLEHDMTIIKRKIRALFDTIPNRQLIYLKLNCSEG
jgi:hypothetical protein